MKKIEILVNGRHAYYTAAKTIKQAVADMRHRSSIGISSTLAASNPPQHWILTCRPEDRVTGRIVGEI